MTNLDEIKDALAKIEEEKRNLPILADDADDAAINERNAVIEDMEKRKAELNKQMEAIEAEARAVQEVQSKKSNVVEITKREDKKMTLADVRSSIDYVNAYAEYIKTNDDRELRTLLSDLVSGGTVPTPTVVQDTIEKAYEKTVLFNRVRKVTDVFGTFEVPFEYAADPASVHTEGGAAVTEENLSLGIVSIKPQMLKKWISVTDEVAVLKGQAFINYINAEIAQRIAELADTQIVNVIKNAGATDTATSVGVKALTPTAITCDTIFTALAELSDTAERNAVAIMNKKTYFNQVMALKDTSGRPIYNVVSENGKPAYYINGVEVIFDSSLATGSSAVILVGDLNAIVATMPGGAGLTFKYDDKTEMTKDVVRILGQQYVGFGLVRPKSWAKVTVTAAG